MFSASAEVQTLRVSDHPCMREIRESNAGRCICIYMQLSTAESLLIDMGDIIIISDRAVMERCQVPTVDDRPIWI